MPNEKVDASFTYTTTTTIPMRKKIVIAINGIGGTGKDTFCEYCYNMSSGLNINSISSMDQIKQIAKDLGWTGSKTTKDRKMLSDLKDLSTEYNDGPFNYIKSRIMKMNSGVLFIHIREIEEIEKVKQFVENEASFEFMSVRINRNVETATNNTGDKGATLDYPYTVEIDNNGTLDELSFKAYEFMKNIKQKSK